MQKKQLVLALLAGVAMPGAAQATLIDRGGGMIYDDVLNITWLQDANYAKTSRYDKGVAGDEWDKPGMMTWSEATAWAADLSYGGYTDWRLPTMIDTGAAGCDWKFSGTDCGYNVQMFDASSGTVYSEMAYMYYVNLGLKPLYKPVGTYNRNSDFGLWGNGTLDSNGGTDSYGQNDVGLIKNLQAYWYWSGLEADPNSVSGFTGIAWIFHQGVAFQGPAGDIPSYAWAVRDGDVAAVPEADTWAMLLAGLGLVGVAARRRRG